jgi:hypothetical protein
MANYYWVGGNGTWDATTTTNWSTTSGGAGGAGVPTSADNAYFDGASDTGAAFTVTVGTDAVCADYIVGDGSTVSALDQTMTLAGSDTLSIHGSWFNPATNYTRTYTGTINFLGAGSHTITTNGISITSVSSISQTGLSFNNSLGEWTLGSALTVASTSSINNFGGGVIIFAGTFNTANYNVTVKKLALVSSAAANFGSSTITLSYNTNGSQGSFQCESGVTLDAGTSTIINTAPRIRFLGGNKNYYNIEFTSTSLDNFSNIISGVLSTNNLTLASRSASGFSFLATDSNITIAGTLSVQSGNTDPTRRIRFNSNTLGTQRTITAAAINFGYGIDFQDIVAAGASSPWDVSALAGGDCKNNSNITFPAAKTVYRIGTGNFSATQWASSSGGSPAADQFPLAQDTMVFDANTTTGTHTINTNYQLGTLDMTNSTTVTLASGTTAPAFYGDITLSNAVTPSGTGAMTFSGRNTQTITSSGRTFTQPLPVNSPSGTIVLADALITNLAITLTNGTLDLNNQTATCNNFSSSNSNTRSIDFGTGKIVLKGTGTVWTTSTNTGFTVAGTPVVDVDNNTATATTVTTGALSEANAISFNFINGAYTLTDTNARYRNLNFTGFGGTVPNSTRTIYGNLTLEGGATNSAGANSTTFAATSGTQQITTDGVTIDYPLVFNAPGAVVEFQDALTQGATRAFTITNGTVEIFAGATSTVGAFGTSGSNQKFLQSTTPGVQATLSQASGTVNASNLTITDIDATGGATWNAFISQGNVDGGNNIGWDFLVQIGRYMYTRRKNKVILQY